MDKAVRDGRDAAETLQRLGEEPDNGLQKIHALDLADVDDLVAVVNEAYSEAYGKRGSTTTMDNHQCPYEKTGENKDCWHCPIPKKATDELVEQTDTE